MSWNIALCRTVMLQGGAKLRRRRWMDGDRWVEIEESTVLNGDFFKNRFEARFK